MCKGAVHDFELFKRNQHLIPKESFVLADKGYQGIYAIYEKSLIPIKAKRGCKLDPVLKQHNREINKRRIGIEHVFGYSRPSKYFQSAIEIEGKGSV